MQPKISRRSLLGAAAAAPVMALGLEARARAETVTEHHRVIVVGTGFGGAISSLRLAQAGVNVLVLERGLRWASGQYGTFSTYAGHDQRGAWLSPWETYLPTVNPNLVPWLPYPGLVERINGDGADLVCGAAVGGSSLIYHGMSVQPRGDLFDRSMPGSVDYDEMDAVYYPRVARNLQIGRMPLDVYESKQYYPSRQFGYYVQQAGLPAVQPVPMTIDWNVVRQEIAGTRPAVISRGEVVYGVNGPGKHSLDTNYIPAAEATGRVSIRTLHRVESIGRDTHGRWTLSVSRINTLGTVVQRINFTCDALFLTAGSANTSKLLVRAAGTGALADLPDGVGGSWGNNGDLLITAILAAPTGAWQGGPANIGTLDWDNPLGPVTIVHGAGPVPVDLHVMQTLSMHIPSSLGGFTYDARHDAVNLAFPADAARQIAVDRVHRLLRAADPDIAIDLSAIEPTTFHPLGGAVIGRVCDAHGRVLGQKGLYVNDSALIPGSTGCVNPSLTVAALAERNIEAIVRSDVGTVF